MPRINYLSLFSGIEAASVAWEPLGYHAMAYADIEPFPSAVLAHRFPQVPNLGDVTAVDWEQWKEVNGSPDVMVAGSPCQAFSVAGKRRSLEDARGNLTLFTAELVRFLQPRIFLWENVPGVLNTKDNAFGCLLGELVGADTALKPNGRWTNAGVVNGPERTLAWRVLDAQYFGVSQRRRRVFIVACPHDGPDPIKILLEPESVRRHTPPSRKQGKATSTSTAEGTGGSSGELYRVAYPINTMTCEGRPSDNGRIGLGLGSESDPQNTLSANHSHAVCIAMSGDELNSKPLDDIGHPCLARDSKGAQYVFREGGFGQFVEEEASGTLKATGGVLAGGSESLVVEPPPIVMAPSFSRRPGQQIANRQDDTCYALTTGEPPRVVEKPAVCIQGSMIGRSDDAGPQGAGINDDVAFTLNTTDRHAVSIQDCREVEKRQNGLGVSEEDTAYTLDTTGAQGIGSAGTVRRLTPLECERLQGFPDNWTLIPWKGKQEEDCPDGPRYKACGNSMAVPVMRWLGARIKAELKVTSQQYGIPESFRREVENR